jgi:hypothetical protein
MKFQTLTYEVEKFTTRMGGKIEDYKQEMKQLYEVYLCS